MRNPIISIMTKKSESCSIKRRMESSLLLDALLEETSDLVLIIDGAQRVRETNRTAKNKLSLPPDAPRGFPLSDILAPDDDGSLAEALASLGSDTSKIRVTASFGSRAGASLHTAVTLRYLAPNGRTGSRILAIVKPTDSLTKDGRFESLRPPRYAGIKRLCGPRLRHRCREQDRSKVQRGGRRRLRLAGGRARRPSRRQGRRKWGSS